STNSGLTWVNVSGNLDTSLIASACCIRLAISPAGSRPIYAVIPVGTDPRAFRSFDSGTTWETLPAFESPPKPIFRLYLISIAADPSDANVVFVGGTTTCGPCAGTPAIFRYNGSSWELMEDSATGNTRSHADSRFLVFDSNKNLLNCDD